MRLLSLHIENFGTLSDVDMDFREGINMILHENGWGKSTLTEFIRVMFYGIEGSKKRGYLENDRKRFQPWNGKRFGGDLSFEVNGKLYKVERNLAAKDADMTFKLYDLNTMLESHDFSEKLGEELFGVDSESFRRTCFVGLDGVRFYGVNSTISAKVSAVDQRGDLGEYDAAEEKLKDYLNKNSSVKKTGSLYKLHEEINDLREQVKDKESLNKRILGLKNNISNVQTLDRLKADVETARRILDRRLNELPEDIPSPDMLKEADEKISIYTEEKSVPKRKSFTDVWILFTICAAFTAGYIFSKFFVLLLIAIAIGIAGLGLLTVKCISNKPDNKLEELSSQLSEMLSKMGVEAGALSDSDIFSARKSLLDLAHSVSYYEREAEEYQKAEERLKEYIRQNPNMASYVTENQYERNLEDAYERLDEINEAEERLAELESEFKEGIEKYEIAELTRDYLKEAKESFVAKYMNPIKNSFDDYYKLISPTDDVFMLDANVNLTRKEEGEFHDIQSQSEGYGDAIGISMRFALLDTMYKKEKPVVILDDPFVGMDEKRLEGTRRLMKSVSEKYQIIYMTCHESRAL